MADYVLKQLRNYIRLQRLKDAILNALPEPHEPEIIRRPPPVIPGEDQDRKVRCAWRESNTESGECTRCGGEWIDYECPDECVEPRQ